MGSGGGSAAVGVGGVDRGGVDCELAGADGDLARLGLGDHGDPQGQHAVGVVGLDAVGVKTLDNSPSLFTISDLSRVWVVCDVYENDLSVAHVGDAVEIRVAAYPERALTGRVFANAESVEWDGWSLQTR